MHNSSTPPRSHHMRVVLAAFYSLSAFLYCGLPDVKADLILVGDTNPSNVPDNAGDVGGDLIIGETATGGLFMDLAPPLDGPLMPLTSDNGILGDQQDAIGAAVFDDFGVEWRVGSQLTVGNEGQGFLDMFDSALIVVGDGTGTTVIGDAATGRGDVTVNGVGTLFNAGDLSVGQGGLGTVNVNSRATLRSQASMIGSEDDTGDGLVTLTDRGTRWSVRGGLTVGGLPGLSHGRIEIINEALLQVEGSGSMTVNPRGTIDLLGGTLRVSPQATNVIANAGVIRGDGFIDGSLVIGPTGELRNAAGLADDREYLLVSEAVISDGLIESSGGEMEFEQRVTSTGVVLARDAIMRFRGSDAGTSTVPDLAINAGTLQVGGDTTIHGDVNIDVGAGAGIIGFGGGVVHFVDNVTFAAAPAPFPLSGLAASSAAPAAASAPATFSVTVGETPPISIGGMLDLGTELLLEVMYDGLVPSMEDDVLTVLTAQGGVSGMFSNTQIIADGRVWDIGYDATEVFITALAEGTELPGDFNMDGEITGSDFLLWQRNPSSYNLGDWRANYGANITGPLAELEVVPEPSTLVLAMLTLVYCPRRRVSA